MSSVTSDLLVTLPRATWPVKRIALNYLSTLAFIALSYGFITSVSTFHRGFLQGQWQLGMFGIDTVITVHAVFVGLLALYGVGVRPQLPQKR